MASLKALSEREQQHHCRSMCFMQKMNALYVVVEGQCYFVYPEHGVDIQNGDGMSIRNKANWNLYQIGTMMQCDEVGRERLCFPNSVAQYKDTQFLVAVECRGNRLREQTVPQCFRLFLEIFPISISSKGINRESEHGINGDVDVDSRERVYNEAKQRTTTKHHHYKYGLIKTTMNSAASAGTLQITAPPIPSTEYTKLHHTAH